MLRVAAPCLADVDGRSSDPVLAGQGDLDALQGYRSQGEDGEEDGEEHGESPAAWEEQDGEEGATMGNVVVSTLFFGVRGQQVRVPQLRGECIRLNCGAHVILWVIAPPKEHIRMY